MKRLAVFLCALLWLFSGCGRPNPGSPSGDFQPLSPQVQFPLSADRVTLSVTNTGDYAGEFQKPVLEVERDGGWYAVSREEVQETSNLLSLPPGETGDFSLFLSPYREELEPGNYRMVFYFVQQEGFFALPFQLLSDEAYAGAEFPAALVVGGALYTSTGRPMPGEAAPSAILGTVRSYAEELPTEEGQSNFDWSCTAPYAETADGLVVLVDHEWTLFEPFGRGN